MNPVLTRLFSDVPLLDEGAFLALIAPSPERERLVAAFAAEMANRITAGEADWAAAIRKAHLPKVEMVPGNLAVLPVRGALAHSPSVEELMFFGMEDTSAVLSTFEGLVNSPTVRGILLDVHSPGGMVTGGTDIADAVASARDKKPVVAWTGGQMASLAYMISAPAQAIVATRMASVGSIGSIGTHVDISRLLENAGIRVEVFTNSAADLKGVRAAVPLTQAQRNDIQARVEHAGRDFGSIVKKFRPAVQDESLRGQQLWGIQAVEAGLVDHIGSRQAALVKLGQMAG